MQSTIIIFPVSVFTNFYFFSVLPSFLFIAAIYFDFMALNHVDNQLRIWNVKEISLARKFYFETESCGSLSDERYI